MGWGTGTEMRCEITVIVADAQPVARLGIRAVLDPVEQITVVGEAGCTQELTALADTLSPSAVVLDGGPSGAAVELSVCSVLMAMLPATRTLAYLSTTSNGRIAAAALAGADSCLLKEDRAELLPDVLARTVDGERVWPSPMPNEPESRTVLELTAEGGLTPKERDVFALMLEHHSNAAIADALVLSTNTVKSHVRSVLRKLGIADRRALHAALRPASTGFEVPRGAHPPSTSSGRPQVTNMLVPGRRSTAPSRTALRRAPVARARQTGREERAGLTGG
jgi:DNA-binding NarL/FixJ family response regulator